MSLKIEPLKWDSDFMNMRVGKITLDNESLDEVNKVKKIAQQDHYELVYLFTEENDLLKDHQMVTEMKLMDRKIIYFMDITSYESSDLSKIETISAVNISKKEVNEIYELAFMSGEYSRFKLDEKFPKEHFTKMYKTWVDNSLNNLIADKTFVYRDQDEIVGFATLRFNEVQFFGEIGLIAVHPEQRGKKLGRRLIEKCIEEAKRRIISKLKIPTQLNNEKACSVYEKIGFHKESITNIYHLWT